MAVQKSMAQSSNSDKLPSPIRVIDECLKEFDVTEEEFYGRSRIKKIVRARRYAGHILFHFCGWSFVKLSKFVERDRTNMMHHVRVLEGELEMYREERDWMYNILERLELIDLSSSGNDWYYAWVHNQLKSADTYMKLIKHDAAEALAEITQVTHADGRVDQSAENKLVREGTFILRAVETVGSVKNLERRKRVLSGNKLLQDYAQTAEPQKFEVKKVNVYNKY